MSAQPNVFHLLPPDLFSWLLDRHFAHSLAPLYQLIVLQYVCRRFRGMIYHATVASKRVFGLRNTAPAHRRTAYVQLAREACRSGCSLSVASWIRDVLRVPNGGFEWHLGAAEGDNLSLLEWLPTLSFSSSDTRAADELLSLAAKHNSLSVLEHLIHKGASPESYHLSRALRNGHLETVKCLHEKHSVGFEMYPFRAAARSGNLQLLKYLVSMAADHKKEENLSLEADLLVLDWALVGGAMDVIHYVCENCLPRNFVPNESLWTMAAWGGSVEAMKFCRERGFKVNNECTAEAVRRGHAEALVFALENGCSLLFREFDVRLAVEMNALAVMKILHERNRELLLSFTRDEILIQVCARGQEEMLRYLHGTVGVRIPDAAIEKAIDCSSPSALSVVKYLFEECGCTMPKPKPSIFGFNSFPSRFFVRRDVWAYLAQRNFIASGNKT